MDVAAIMDRLDALTAAQNRTAVATLAAAIVQVRNSVAAPEIMAAVEDAEHIINPQRGNSRNTEWRRRHGLNPA